MTLALTDAELLARLVAFDSTSVRSNLPIADFVCEILDRPGVRIERFPSADGTKVNLVVEVGPPPSGDGRGLVLSGHLDVVPAGEGWATEPFTLTDLGDRWAGRGTADMKGFLALATNRARRAAELPLAAPLLLIFTYDEELGCLGAGRLAATWPADRPLPKSALIGEPTSLAVVRMHKGHLKLRVTLHGVAAHSGYPHLGANAIEPAARVILALAALREELEAERPRHGEHFGEVPFVALNVGRVEGGTAINVVPERCVIELGLRPLPEMSSAPLLARVSAAVAAAAPAGRFTLEVINESPPMLLAEDAPIYRTLTRLVGQGHTASASYATDAGWLSTLGLDCAIFGPGTIEVAHKPDESLPKAEFEAAGALLDRLIAELSLAH